MRLQVLSKSSHSGLRWKRYVDYKHAANRNLVSLAAAELSKAALALPLTFTKQHGRWSLCALLGLTTDVNLYVTPYGQWVGTYIPAALRGHPFYLGWEGIEANLCVDEDSELFVTDDSGEPVFNNQGDLTESVEKVWDFLSQTATSLLILEEACSVLASADLIEPWLINVQGPDGIRTVESLYRINEAAMNALDDVVFNRLRRAGVLGVAYAQLLSMGNLADLGKLAQARAEAEVADRAKAEVKPMITLPDDSTIDWDWSKVGKT